MIYTYKFSPKAIEDLDEVWNDVFEASKSYEISDKYIDDLIDKINKKKEFPHSGIPLTYKGMNLGVYSINFKKYKVFYIVSNTEMLVLRILLGKREYLKVLFKEEENEET